MFIESKVTCTAVFRYMCRTKTPPSIDGYIKSLTVPCKNESYLVLVEDLASCDAYVSNSIHINMGGTKIE